MREKISPLEHQLQQCSLYPLLLITSKVLSISGFGDVQVMGRRHVKQKTKLGGFELECRGTYAGQPMRVLVKVIGDGVRQRMTDEMAGAVIRTGADLGLIVSPFHVTRQAAKNLGKYHRARIEVLDGKTLAAYMRRFNIGVRPNGEPDYAFFGGLEDEANHLLSLISHLTYD